MKTQDEDKILYMAAALHRLELGLDMGRKTGPAGAAEDAAMVLAHFTGGAPFTTIRLPDGVRVTVENPSPGHMGNKISRSVLSANQTTPEATGSKRRKNKATGSKGGAA